MYQNVIIAYCNCLESYFGETNVMSLIIEKPNVWSPIIANFSFCLPQTHANHAYGSATAASEAKQDVFISFQKRKKEKKPKDWRAPEFSTDYHRVATTHTGS